MAIRWGSSTCIKLGDRHGGRGAGVVLCGQEGQLFARGFGDDLAEVLVAALGGLPGGVAEGLAGGVEVEFIHEGLVVGFVGGGCDWCHGWGNKIVGFIWGGPGVVGALGLERSIYRNLG